MKIFQRLPRKGPVPGPPPPRAAASPAEPEEWVRPWPRVDATVAALFGLILTAFAMTSGADRVGSQLAHTTSVGVFITLLASLAFEARGGLRNLVRPDLVGIIALYYLTLYEFLFPQPYFDVNMRDPRAVYLALWAVLIGFAGLLLGRHLVPKGKQAFEDVMTKPLSPMWLSTILWMSFFLGFLHVLIAVKFELPQIFEAMVRGRFEQPWGRGKFGDWKALINEMSLLLYLVPPIVGLMFGARERYSPINLLLALLAFLWLLFFGFAAGTRMVFAAYLITFLIAFTFSSPPDRRIQVILVAAICGATMLMATRVMLDMRGMGLKRWWAGEKQFGVSRYHSYVFVDDNLLAIAAITKFFPERTGGRYLGLEIPYLSLVRPIPRAIWPGKPTGMSVAIEDVFNVRGVTVTATFVGEAYMSGGLFGVALEALVLGMLSTFWNRLASPKNSALGLLVYSSGFFAVTTTMRSSLTLTTAILPCVLGILFGKFILPRIRQRLKPRAIVPPRLRKRPPTPPTAES